MILPRSPAGRQVGDPTVHAGALVCHTGLASEGDLMTTVRDRRYKERPCRASASSAARPTSSTVISRMQS